MQPNLPRYYKSSELRVQTTCILDDMANAGGRLMILRAMNFRRPT
jgi:hypothetical protein